MRAALTLLRRAALAAVLGLVALMGATQADDATEKAALDTLFAQLRAAPDPVTANAITQQIWFVWTTPTDPVLAGRMHEVIAARTLGDFAGCLALLDKLVEDYPDYAEGWNQRATINYMLDDFDASLADIDKVLALEPRHFGALSGRVLIYLAQGKRPLALRDMERALAIHPFLNERGLFPELQQEMVRT